MSCRSTGRFISNWLLVQLLLLSEQGCLRFALTIDMDNHLLFESGAAAAFFIASNGRVAPIVLDARVDESVHIAVATFADDIERVTGHRPEILAKRPSPGVRLIEVQVATKHDQPSDDPLAGKWESFSIKVAESGMTLAITGSDKVGYKPLSRVDKSAGGNLRTVHSVRTHGRFPLVLVVRCTHTNSINHRLPARCHLPSRPAERQVSWSLPQR